MATMLEFIHSGQTSVPIDDVMENEVSGCIGSLYYASTHGSTPEVKAHANKLRSRLTSIRSNAMTPRYVDGKPVPLSAATYAGLYSDLAEVYRDIKILKPFLPAESLELLVYNGALHVVGCAWSASGKLAGHLKPEIRIDF